LKAPNALVGATLVVALRKKKKVALKMMRMVARPKSYVPVGWADEIDLRREIPGNRRL
jgi:hypothetical protein